MSAPPGHIRGDWHYQTPGCWATESGWSLTHSGDQGEWWLMGPQGIVNTGRIRLRDAIVYADQFRAAQQTPPFAFTVSDTAGCDWTPWTDGFAVGYEVTERATGAKRWAILNPTHDPLGGPSTVFLYVSPRPSADAGNPILWVDPMGDEWGSHE